VICSETKIPKVFSEESKDDEEVLVVQYGDDDEIIKDTIPGAGERSQRAYDSPIWGNLWGTLKEKVEVISDRLSPEDTTDLEDENDGDNSGDNEDDEDEVKVGFQMVASYFL